MHQSCLKSCYFASLLSPCRLNRSLSLLSRCTGVPPTPSALKPVPFLSMRYVCIHGHFYQPPRENPWLDEVEVQDSAAPYHDWNARITAECYWPNAAARLLGHGNRITAVVNNYAS